MQIDFNTAFERVSHRKILYKLWYWRFCVVCIDTVSLKNRSLHVSVDDCRSKLVSVPSGMTQGSVLGLLLSEMGMNYFEM